MLNIARGKKIAQMDTVYCPIKGDQINGKDCLIICDVVDGLLKPTTMPSGISWNEEMREICKSCMYHEDIM